MTTSTFEVVEAQSAGREIFEKAPDEIAVDRSLWTPPQQRPPTSRIRLRPPGIGALRPASETRNRVDDVSSNQYYA